MKKKIGAEKNRLTKKDLQCGNSLTSISKCRKGYSLNFPSAYQTFLGFFRDSWYSYLLMLEKKILKSPLLQNHFCMRFNSFEEILITD